MMFMKVSFSEFSLKIKIYKFLNGYNTSLSEDALSHIFDHINQMKVKAQALNLVCQNPCATKKYTRWTTRSLFINLYRLQVPVKHKLHLLKIWPSPLVYFQPILERGLSETFLQ